LAADEVVPKKWFATKLAELKSLLKMPHHESVRSWGWVIEDRVVSWFTKFQSEFEAMVGNDQARLVIKQKVDSAIKYLEILSGKLRTLGELSSQYYSSNEPRDPVQAVKQFGWSEVTGKMEKTCKTIGDLFKYEWVVDQAVLERLAQKTVKKATPAEIESILGDSDREWRIKWEFLTRVGFYAAAGKAVKKSKLDWNPLGWFTKTQEIFEENYAPGLTPAYRNFELYGMKILVADPEITDKEVREYIGYLKEAYERLRIRGLETAWYGETIIWCKDCGGSNYNTGGGVGGHYFTGPDTVRIYARPSTFIVALMAHELGHRYWFKQMRQEQRLRFKELVKARTVARPKDAPKDVALYSENHLSRPKYLIQTAERAILALVSAVATGVSTPEEEEGYRKQIRELSSGITDAVSGVRGLRDAFNNPDVEKLDRATWSEGVSVRWHADDLPKVRPAQRDQWVTTARVQVKQLVDKAMATLDLALKVHNEAAEAKLAEHPDAKAWQQSYLDNHAPVEPVSDYGKSDIDEAFAEVFSHYVLNFDITRDQMESFRSVLSEPGAHRRQGSRGGALITRVARRFVTAVV
jgi:hypothetical protein